MTKTGALLASLTPSLLLVSYLAVAQQPPPTPAPGQPGQGRAQAPPQPMSFFVTSVGKGDGANYGGLAGADAYCQQVGAAAGRGAGVTWHAYLSTQGPGAVNARDRIGNGPWFNARGGRVAMNAAELHGDTLEQAQIGNALGKQISLTEKSTPVNGIGDTPNQHDILTGSQANGRAYTDTMDHTCSNYTSNADGRGSVQLGHVDKQGGNNGSWNSSHPSRGCSQMNLVSTGGAGLLYCFAVN
jgi:hypothetical protein